MKKSKQWRRENKIKKMTALLEISELNNRDRMNAAASSVHVDSNASLDNSPDEPICKKLKLSDDPSCIDTKQSSQTELDDSGREKYSEEELAKLRSLLKESYNKYKKRPTLSLKEPGLQARLDVPTCDRVPLFLSDIQALILATILKCDSPVVPRWYKLIKSGHLSSVRILFIEGAGLSDHLLANEKLTVVGGSSFPIPFEVVMPSAYCGNLVEELCAVPLARNQYDRLVRTYGSLQKAVKKPNSGVFRVLRAFFPVQLKSEHGDDSDIDSNIESSSKEKTEQSDVKKEDFVDSMKSSITNACDSKDEKTNSLKETKSQEIETVPSNGQESSLQKTPTLPKLPPSDKFPRTALLLSAWQMIEEGYPLLLNDEMKHKYQDFVFTKAKYKEVNNFSPMYGLDCEMCITVGGKSEVTRVAIVNEKHETVLDSLVLPYNRIVQYLTKYSGITPSMMKGVTTRLEHIQDYIRDFLEPDAILVGQSLQFDLKALKVIHPYCIDTSVILNVTGDRYRKAKLSKLSELFLSEDIQKSKDGHSPVEDSLASLKLAQLKLQHSLEFGDEVLKNQGTVIAESAISLPKKQQKPRLKEDISGYATSLFSLTSRKGEHATIVSTPELLEHYIDYLDAKTTTYEQYGSILPDPNEGSGDKSLKTGGVTCVIADSNKSVVKRTTKNASNSFLTLGHIRLTADESDSSTLQEHKILEEVNSYIAQMQEDAPLNSLSLVVLCGREKSSNGACFMKLATQAQHLKFQPKDSAT